MSCERQCAMCNGRYSKPPGFEVRHLHLDKEDVTEMIKTYKTDASVFHKVAMKNVYAVATGDDENMLPMVILALSRTFVLDPSKWKESWQQDGETLSTGTSILFTKQTHGTNK